MVFKNASERVGEALLQAHLHWQKERPESAGLPSTFTIAISREAGAQGSQIAQILGQHLGWPVYDRELLNKIAEEKGLRVQMLEHVDERHVGWLHECVENFLAISRISEEAYVHYLVKTLFTLTALGECILVGRGAAQILPPERTLRVRLVGPKKDRIAAVRKKLSLSEEAASRWVEQTDRERANFVRAHFDKDIKDPCSYDLVLNTSRFSAQAAADLIVQGLHQFQEKAGAALTAS